MTLKLVSVQWLDAHGSATANVTLADLSLHHQPILMTTVGWLLRRDQQGLSIACERSQEHGLYTYRGHTFIPRAMVKKVSTL